MDATAKTKFLCSFGGKIAPRAADGALRYVGGDTRIVSVRRGAPFHEVMQKMVETNGGPAVVKYQLPDEDLDALVTVSCPEDLENMMEEYRKLDRASHTDGARKLRVFLFDDHAARAKVGATRSTPPQTPPFAAPSTVPPQKNVPVGADSVPATVASLYPQGHVHHPPLIFHDVNHVSTTADLQHGNPPPIPPPSLLGFGAVPPGRVGYVPAPPRSYVKEVGGAVMGPPPSAALLSDMATVPSVAAGGGRPDFPSPPHKAGVTSQQATLPGAADLLQGFHSVAQIGKEMVGLDGTDDFGRSGIDLLPLVESPSSNLPCSRGVIADHHPRNHLEELSQQQEPYLRYEWGPAERDVLTTGPTRTDISVSEANEIVPTYEPPLLHATTELSYDKYATPVKEMMGMLHVSPPQTTLRASALDEQRNMFAETNLRVSEEVTYGGMDIFSANTYACRGGPREQQVTTTLPQAIYYLQNLPPAGSSHLRGEVGPYPPDQADLVVVEKPQIPRDQLFSVPSVVGSVPVCDSKMQASAPKSGGASSDTFLPHINGLAFTSPQHVSPSECSFEVSNPSDCFFINQDPWGVLQDARLLDKMSEGEPFNVKTSINDNQSRIRNFLKIPLFPEEEEYYQLPDVTRNASPFSLMEDEKIKQELQATAEDVASSVLQPSLTTGCHDYDVIVSSLQVIASEGNQNNAVLHKSMISGENKHQDIQTKESEKLDCRFQIPREIGRVQVIKNIDLEELRELGSGTFGTVYHGQWKGSDVAIKRITDRCFAGKPTEQDRMMADFWNEACKLSDLHHPNVVAFYGIVLDGPGGSIATVTEYMVNGSLRNVLQNSEKKFDQRRRLILAMDVAFGMEYLHGKNIVHFDLKSDNLLVNLSDSQRPICKVGDLGLSKVKHKTLISGGVRGTLPWMAPELLNGSSSLVSEKVDVFSFGIVMWELLTGEEPYTDLHYGAIIGGIVSNTLRPPIPESCDSQWRSLMEECWSSEPSERPSFTEIVKKLCKITASFS